MNRITALCLLLGFLATSPVWAKGAGRLERTAQVILDLPDGPEDKDQGPVSRMTGAVITNPDLDINGTVVTVTCVGTVVIVKTTTIHSYSCRSDGKVKFLGNLQSSKAGNSLEISGTSLNGTLPTVQSDGSFSIKVPSGGEGVSVSYKEAIEYASTPVKPSKSPRKTPSVKEKHHVTRAE